MMEELWSVDLITFSTNLGSGLICLMLGAFLLLFNTEHKEDRKGYVSVKRFLAIAAFLASVSNCLVNWAVVEGMDFRFLLTFIVPCICYWQLHTVTVALLSLIHSPKATMASRFYWVLPVLTLTIVHIVGFFLYDGVGEWLGGRYAHYCCTPFSHTLTTLLFAAIGAEFVFYAWTLMAEVRQFIKKIDNFFTGRTEDRVKILAMIVRCFLIYFVFAGVDMVVSSQVEGNVSFLLNAAFMWVNTGAFIVGVVVVFNLQNVYFTSVPAFEWERKAEEAEANGDHGDDEVDVVGMEERVQSWCDNGKPYLAEGISLADAAEGMAVSPRLLSSHLNSVCHMNFNTWINSLRVEEVKRIVIDEPDVSMADIATRTGFTNASALSRMFKRLTGETPTSYRGKTVEE